MQVSDQRVYEIVLATGASALMGYQSSRV